MAAEGLLPSGAAADVAFDRERASKRDALSLTARELSRIAIAESFELDQVQ